MRTCTTYLISLSSRRFKKSKSNKNTTKLMSYVLRARTSRLMRFLRVAYSHTSAKNRRRSSLKMQNGKPRIVEWAFSKKWYRNGWTTFGKKTIFTIFSNSLCRSRARRKSSVNDIFLKVISWNGYIPICKSRIRPKLIRSCWFLTPLGQVWTHKSTRWSRQATRNFGAAGVNRAST